MLLGNLKILHIEVYLNTKKDIYNVQIYTKVRKHIQHKEKQTFELWPSILKILID